MFIRVETSSGIPITRQIADQIRSHAASGALQAGDRLPSVRQLARQLLVNHNTILRVYERLTAQGLLESRHGDGTYLTIGSSSGRAHNELAKAQRELLARQVDGLAHQATDLNVRPADVHEMLDDAFTRIGRKRPDGGVRAATDKRG